MLLMTLRSMEGDAATVCKAPPATWLRSCKLEPMPCGASIEQHSPIEMNRNMACENYGVLPADFAEEVALWLG